MSRLNPLISIHYFLGNKTDGCLNNQYLKFIIMHKTVSFVAHRKCDNSTY